MDISKSLMQLFPEIFSEKDTGMQQIFSDVKKLSFPGNQLISSVGTLCENYILVVSGSLKVQILTDSGREVVLYHVQPGEGCMLTTSCLLSGEPFPAEGVSDSELEVLALTAASFDQALNNSPVFRRFIFSQLGARLIDVITRIEHVCSHSIDRNLAQALLKLRNGGTGITTTHQELASELGTAREVVSRHLKRFEANGWIRLGRGTIQLNESDVLMRIAQK